MSRASYSYRVVTSNGHGVHSRDFRRCGDAKKHAAIVAQRDGRHNFGPYEIERVQHFGNSRNYQLRCGSRWVQWDPRQDAAARQPDWIYGDERREEAA